MSIKHTRFAALLALLGACLLPNAASATPNIIGVYSGTLSGTETRFAPSPLPPEPSSVPLTVTIDSQSGSSFSGTANDAEGGTATLSGSIDSAGTILSGSFSSTDPDGTTSSGTFSGAFSSTSLSLTVTGSDTFSPSGELFNFTESGVLARVTNSSTDPALTTPTDITTPTQLNGSMRFFSQSITQRFNVFRAGSPGGASAVSNGLMLQGNGMNAGEGMPYPFGVWGSFSRTDSKDDSAARTFDSDRYQFLGGIDFSPKDGLLVGVAVGYETTDVTTRVNSGSQDINGFTVAPYLATLFGDNFSADVSVGMSSIDIDQSRVLAGSRLTSSVDSTRLFAAGNLNASKAFGDLLINAQVGLLYARDKHDAFTETASTFSVANGSRTYKLGQFHVGAEASYLAGEFEPFASVALERDFRTTSSVGVATDRTGGVVGFGVRYFGSRNGVSGSIDYRAVVGRKNLDEGTFGANLRVDF